MCIHRIHISTTDTTLFCRSPTRSIAKCVAQVKFSIFERGLRREVTLVQVVGSKRWLRDNTKIMICTKIYCILLRIITTITIIIIIHLFIFELLFSWQPKDAGWSSTIISIFIAGMGQVKDRLKIQGRRFGSNSCGDSFLSDYQQAVSVSVIF